MKVEQVRGVTYFVVGLFEICYPAGRSNCSLDAGEIHLDNSQGL